MYSDNVLDPIPEHRESQKFLNYAYISRFGIKFTYIIHRRLNHPTDGAKQPCSKMSEENQTKHKITNNH
jgi:hypothetical protein